MEVWEIVLLFIGVYLMGFLTGRASGVVYTLAKLNGGGKSSTTQPRPEELAALLNNLPTHPGGRQ